MSMTDYAEVLVRLQKALGREFRMNGAVLNQAGKSVACKVDPNHYLAPEPLFAESLARMAAVLPDTVRATLVRTGNVLTPPGNRGRAVLGVGVRFGFETRVYKACFVLAEFIDRALILYGGRESGLEISNLKIRPEYRPVLEEFFKGKTFLHDMAFAPDLGSGGVTGR